VEQTLSAARNGSKFRFHSAIRKYGKDNFLLEVLETCKSEGEMRKKEIGYIEKYNTMKFGYNATAGGSGGWIVNPENYEKWHKNNKRSVQGVKNGNSCGFTDKELIDFCVEYCLELKYIPGLGTFKRHLRTKNIKFPIYFSKNRFKGSNEHFYNLLEQKTKLKHTPGFKSEEHKQLLRKANLGKKYKTIEGKRIWL